MEIRSITLFVPNATDPTLYAPFLAGAAATLPFPTQSLRVATTPFPDWWPDQADVDQAQGLAASWVDAGATYVALGPIQPWHDDGWLARLPAILGATEMLFASVTIAGGGEVHVGRCRQMARLIRRVSQLRPDGFGNLFLTALANCPPGAPFFPVAYHDGGPARFALALEAADVALGAITGASSLAEARANLVSAIEAVTQELSSACDALGVAYGIPCAGFDFSLAPFPAPGCSLAGALEAIGVPTLGAPGSLFAAAFLTEALGRARFPRAGFNGLMLPVLEDAVLADRAATGTIGISDLLSYAAVCGVGLDTVPLPGDVGEETLTAILLDTAALAARLDKPLTARLMPFPGKVAGDQLTFDFPYFANSRVMAVNPAGLRRPVVATDRVTLRRIGRG